VSLTGEFGALGENLGGRRSLIPGISFGGIIGGIKRKGEYERENQSRGEQGGRFFKCYTTPRFCSFLKRGNSGKTGKMGGNKWKSPHRSESLTIEGKMFLTPAAERRVNRGERQRAKGEAVQWVWAATTRQGGKPPKAEKERNSV